MLTSHLSLRGSAVLLAAGVFTFASYAAAPARAYVSADATAATASTSTATASYQGSPITGTVIGHTTNWFTQGAPVTSTATNRIRAVPNRTPGNHSGTGPTTSAAALPSTSTSSLAAEGSLAANFNGANDAQNKTVAGFHDTPPDQGLCVGNTNVGKLVIEIVNSYFAIYNTSGTQLGAFDFPHGYMDPNAFSDPRCFYDASTHSFYMTVISCSTCGPPGGADSADDILVVDAAGNATTYQYSTNEGGTCFGDQPHTGYDSHAVYMATDQFCGTNGNIYTGALLIGLSKSQLVAQGAPPNADSFGPVSLSNNPILTLEPAFGNESGKEYLLNSFPYDQFGNNNSIANTLGFWVVNNDSNITSGGVVTLNGKIIGSETYAFPQPAASTGSGATTTGPGCPMQAPNCETSEAFLNPDDSRMLQVQLINGEDGGLQLYAALSTALNINHDPSARDGAAWFVLDPTQGKVTKQGYVGVAGAYLLYPAILHTSEGTTAMGFTLTSPTINPSAAYVVWKSTSSGFGAVQTVAAGSGPHVSYSDVLFGRGRWGDYSALELDPNGTNIWSATEYIPPPPAGSDPTDNWGTRVWDVVGDS